MNIDVNYGSKLEEWGTSGHEENLIRVTLISRKIQPDLVLFRDL